MVAMRSRRNGGLAKHKIQPESLSLAKAANTPCTPMARPLCHIAEKIVRCRWRRVDLIKTSMRCGEIRSGGVIREDRDLKYEGEPKPREKSRKSK